MDRDDLAFVGVARQAELVRSGEVSSVELVELYLERIHRIEPELNAFWVVMGERALAAARQADARRGAGEERPLLGVPIAVKDTEDVAGVPTAWGTAIRGAPAVRDNDLVARLRAAGAVILGKTNLPELAIIGDTEGPAFGFTRNPWNTAYSPGGSSGGSAAAVAAGLCAAATASDGAGSIRIPASCCGLVGMKPQRDRVSLGAFSGHWHGLTVAGFVTRKVEDTALLLDVAAQHKGARPFVEAVRARSVPRPAPVGPLRIALSFKAALRPTWVHREVRASLHRVADALRTLGHDVTEHEPSYGRASDAVVARYLNGIAQDALSFPEPKRLQRRTRGFIRLGNLVPQPLVDKAIRGEARHAARIGALFRDHDVLLTPTIARLPVRAARWEGVGALRTLLEMSVAYPFTPIWNLTGQPAISIPAPPSRDGLPIGAQLIAPEDGEEQLLGLAAQLERELGWPALRPPLP
jgi:amidase